MDPVALVQGSDDPVITGSLDFIIRALNRDIVSGAQFTLNPGIVIRRLEGLRHPDLGSMRQD